MRSFTPALVGRVPLKLTTEKAPDSNESLLEDLVQKMSCCPYLIVKRIYPYLIVKRIYHWTYSRVFSRGVIIRITGRGKTYGYFPDASSLGAPHGRRRLASTMFENLTGGDTGLGKRRLVFVKTHF